MATPDPVALLSELIAFDTQNPTGDEVALCRRLAAELDSLGADEVTLREIPRPRGRCGYVYARFGAPSLLINAHVDTVPANTGWTGDPLVARVEGARIYGLGACDTKGSIAAILCAIAAARPRNLGVLLSGDEEHGTRCVRAFLSSEQRRGIERAIVCEPSSRKAGIRHRGILARTAHFAGRGGHSSKADDMPKPIVMCARLALALDEIGARYRGRGPDGMKGLCTNVAAIEGGVAFNVVPDAARLLWSIRPYPGFDPGEYERELAAAIAATEATFELSTQLDHPPFFCRDPGRFAELLGGVEQTELDFWTEAALYAQSGIDCAVVGPGEIRRAHAPDEFVDRDDLEWAIAVFSRVMAG